MAVKHNYLRIIAGFIISTESSGYFSQKEALCGYFSQIPAKFRN